MPILVPNIGEVRLLRYIIGDTTPSQGLVLHLYSNNKAPAETDTESNYTAPTALGYAPSTLSPSSWSVGTDGSSGTSSALYNNGITFTFGTAASTQNVYGYYVTDTSNNLLWAENFPNGQPFALPASGGEIAIRPQVQLS